MKVSGCKGLLLQSENRYWFRALNLKHWKTRLETDHTKTVKSRFSLGTPARPLYRMLYLGDNHQVAIYEVGALLGDPNAPISSPRGSWVLMSLSVRLHHVANLSVPSQQKLISTNDQELTGVWANNAVSTAAPTQKLGAALYAIPKLEGFIYPSSKTGSHNLVIFMDKLDKSSLITFSNELNGRNENLR